MMRAAGIRILRAIALTSVFFALFSNVPAVAHTKSESHTNWRITAETVYLTFTVPEIEVKRLARTEGEQPSNEEVGLYLADHVAVTARDKLCDLIASPRPVAAVTGFRRFELGFHCPNAEALKLSSSAFFDFVPSHVTFAQITTDDGTVTEQLITKDRQTLELSGEGGDNHLQDANFFEYVRLGIMHILTGPDHISFLIGLVLISRTWRDLIFVITGFTLGHSVTLALAVTGIVRPHAEFIDALIGLTIMLIGAENIAVASHRPGIVALGIAGLLGIMAVTGLLGFGGLPPLLLLGAGLFTANYLMISGQVRDAARLRLAVTLVFGLIHGFGFAADLLEMRLPATRLAELLVGFNLGVELGQLTLVLIVTLLTTLLIRLRFALPRPIVVDVASSGLLAFGSFLLISRSYA